MNNSIKILIIGLVIILIGLIVFIAFDPMSINKVYLSLSIIFIGFLVMGYSIIHLNRKQ